MRLVQWTLTLLSLLSLLAGAAVLFCWEQGARRSPAVYFSPGNGRLWMIASDPDEHAVHFIAARDWNGVRQVGICDWSTMAMWLWDDPDVRNLPLGARCLECQRLWVTDASGKLITGVEALSTAQFPLPSWELELPYPLAFAATLPLPIIWLGVRILRWRRKRFRRQRGYCVDCGYNLTGISSTVCPECGKAI